MRKGIWSLPGFRIKSRVIVNLCPVYPWYFGTSAWMWHAPLFSIVCCCNNAAATRAAIRAVLAYTETSRVRSSQY
jgi:hypothetical protein